MFSLLTMLSLSACAGSISRAHAETTQPLVSTQGATAIPQTGYTSAVPATYQAASAQPGTVTRLDYESRDYVRDSAPITKTAYVYTPYGYDENDTETRYNILYLMHGWGGHAGEYFSYTETKNVFDNLIANGDIPPLIIVSATFYNANSDTDFSSSIEEFRAFHLDFENHLMPAVEGWFHTFAVSTSDEDLKASRDHRAFSGYSRGAVMTWRMLHYGFEYFKYFAPMSCMTRADKKRGETLTETEVIDFVTAPIKAHPELPFFIFASNGGKEDIQEMNVQMNYLTKEHASATVRIRKRTISSMPYRTSTTPTSWFPIIIGTP